MSNQEYLAAAPLIILAITGCLCLLLEVAGVPVGARKLGTRGHIALIAMLGLAFAGVWQLVRCLDGVKPHFAFSKAVRIDGFGLFFGFVICLAALLAIMVAVAWLRARDLERGEYYAIIVFTALGMIALAQASDLLFLFVALETLSVGVYILTGIDRKSSRSPEGAIKYFLNGAFAAGILLFGSALIYGASGTTELEPIGDILRGGAAQNQPLMIAGFIMVVLGLGFKVAAFPFHMWTPDVYEGAPAPSTAFMAAGVKAAAFAALIRVVVAGLGNDSATNETAAGAETWVTAGWIFAVATMTWGNLAALAQSRVKRMLAYSSIAHAGYALAGLVAVVSGHQVALSAIGFYLLAYALMTVGAFGVVAFLERENGKGTSYEEWAGAARRYPLVGLSMAVFIFSLAGIPPTAGFLAKFYLFSSVVDSGLYWLAFFAIINSLISVYYYLRVLVYMYMKEPHPKLDGKGGAFMAAGLATAAVLVLLIGMLPTSVMKYAQRVLDVF